MVQYVKGKWETGERHVLETFPDQVEIRTMGEGFTWDTQEPGPGHPRGPGGLAGLQGHGSRPVGAKIPNMTWWYWTT